MKRLLATLKNWARNLEGMDDPHGLYLQRLEQRIRALEEAQRDLRPAPFDTKPQP